MRPPPFESLEPFAHRMLAWAPALGHALRSAARWGAAHTGLPAVVVAAVAIVAGWHLFRRSMRFFVEVIVTVTLLVAATRCGWLTW